MFHSLNVPLTEIVIVIPIESLMLFVIQNFDWAMEIVLVTPISVVKG